MATYSRYSPEDLEKALAAVDKGYTYQWAAGRYGVPVGTVKKKYKQRKEEQRNEEVDT